MMLILAPPDPSKGVWTVDGAAAALDLSGEEASPVAEWQLQTGTCAGRLAYDLATLTAAFAQPATASTRQSTCVADDLAGPGGGRRRRLRPSRGR